MANKNIELLHDGDFVKCNQSTEPTKMIAPHYNRYDDRYVISQVNIEPKFFEREINAFGECKKLKGPCKMKTLPLWANVAEDIRTDGNIRIVKKDSFLVCAAGPGWISWEGSELNTNDDPWLAELLLWEALLNGSMNVKDEELEALMNFYSFLNEKEARDILEKIKKLQYPQLDGFSCKSHGIFLYVFR